MEWERKRARGREGGGRERAGVGEVEGERERERGRGGGGRERGGGGERKR